MRSNSVNAVRRTVVCVSEYSIAFRTAGKPAAQVFGSVAPLVYAAMIGPKDAPSETCLFYDYILGAVVMMIGGVVAAVLGIDAEQKSLEDVAMPLSVVRATGVSGSGA